MGVALGVASGVALGVAFGVVLAHLEHDEIVRLRIVFDPLGEECELTMLFLGERDDVQWRACEGRHIGQHARAARGDPQRVAQPYGAVLTRLVGEGVACERKPRVVLHAGCEATQRQHHATDRVVAAYLRVSECE